MPSQSDPPVLEQWLKLKLPVRIWGMDSAGHAFQLRTETVEVKRTAARLKAVEGLKTGDVIGLQFEESKGRFKVARVGAPGSPDGGNVLIESLVPGICLWGDALIQHTMLPGETGWAQPTVSTVSAPILERRIRGESEAPVERRNKNRRQAERFPCAGTVEVNSNQTKFPLWATISDVSSGGCYIETRTPMPLETPLEMSMKISGSHFQARGIVRTMHPMVGMGVAYLSMNSSSDQEVLRSLLNQLSTEETEQTLPVYPVPAQSAGEMDRDTRAMSRVPQLLAQVAEMEDLLKNTSVQGRILNDFHEALFHTQRTLGNIQRFLDLNRKKEDPYSVLQSVHEERIRVANQLLSHLAMDMDSLEVHAQTQGVAELRQAVQGLVQRFSALSGERSDIFER